MTPREQSDDGESSTQPVDRRPMSSLLSVVLVPMALD